MSLADGAAAAVAAKANPTLAAAKLEKNDAKREGRKASGALFYIRLLGARARRCRARPALTRAEPARAGSVKSFA